jgi:hypothetical protein
MRLTLIKRFLFQSVVIIDDDDPLAADEPVVHGVAVQVGKTWIVIYFEAVVLLEESLIKRGIDQHGVVFFAKLVVAAAGYRMATASTEAAPELVEVRTVFLDQAGGKPAVREIREFTAEFFLLILAEQLFLQRSAPAAADDEPVTKRRAEASALAAKAVIFEQLAAGADAGVQRCSSGRHGQGDE